MEQEYIQFRKNKGKLEYRYRKFVTNLLNEQTELGNAQCVESVGFGDWSDWLEIEKETVTRFSWLWGN